MQELLRARGRVLWASYGLDRVRAVRKMVPHPVRKYDEDSIRQSAKAGRLVLYTRMSKGSRTKEQETVQEMRTQLPMAEVIHARTFRLKYFVKR